MLLCFVDESGSPPQPQRIGNRPYFVMAGLMMHESQWHEVSEDVRRLKSRAEYRIQGEIKWRYFGLENKDADNSVSHLDKTARDAFRSSLFDIITRRKSLKIVCCATNVAEAYKLSPINTHDDLYHYTYKPVSERFQYHLQDLSRALGEKQLGIIIADPRGKKQDDNLRRQHQSLMDAKAPFVSTYENFVETIFFIPSHLSVGLQLADMVAGAIGRALKAGDKRFIDMIEPSFRRRRDGSIGGIGFVKFPTKRWDEVPSGGGQSPLAQPPRPRP